MNDAQYVQWIISKVRPRAKFVNCDYKPHTGAQYLISKPLYYVSVYDESIDSNVLSAPRALIIVHNTYLESFAYNVLTCWLWAGRQPDFLRSEGRLYTLLRYNFKKFFAEQFLRQRESLFAKALFLETLLFEQAAMARVGDEEEALPELRRSIRLGAKLMSSLVLGHELGHVVLQERPSEWDEVMRDHLHLKPVATRVEANFLEQFVEDFRCDVMAIVGCMKEFENEFDVTSRLRLIAFGLCAFGVLLSLAESAARTAAAQTGNEEDVDLSAEFARYRGFEYTAFTNKDISHRIACGLEVCEAIAKKEGVVLWGMNGAIPLPHESGEYLNRFMREFLEVEDSNVRAMALRVAESLSGHDEGFEYLYRISKRYRYGEERWKV